MNNTQNGSLSFLGGYSYLRVVSPILKDKNVLWGEGENARKGYNSQISEFSRISIRLVFGSSVINESMSWRDRQMNSKVNIMTLYTPQSTGAGM